MWSKQALALAAALTLASSVSAHSGITGSTQAQTALQRSQVTRGSSTSCPKSSANVGAPAEITNGVVTLFAKSFNGGTDGGLQYTMGLSVTGPTGTFKPVTVTQQGPANPPAATEATVKVAIPPGTDCSKGQCTLAADSNGGFGNCVQITGTSGSVASNSSSTVAESSSAAKETAAETQSASATKASNATAAQKSATAGNNANDKGKGKGKGKGKHHKHHKGKKAGAQTGTQGANKAQAPPAKTQAPANKAPAANNAKVTGLRTHPREFFD